MTNDNVTVCPMQSIVAVPVVHQMRTRDERKNLHCIYYRTTTEELLMLSPTTERGTGAPRDDVTSVAP